MAVNKGFTGTQRTNRKPRNVKVSLERFARLLITDAIASGQDVSEYLPTPKVVQATKTVAWGVKDGWPTRAITSGDRFGGLAIADYLESAGLSADQQAKVNDIVKAMLDKLATADAVAAANEAARTAELAAKAKAKAEADATAKAESKPTAEIVAKAPAAEVASKPVPPKSK